MKKLFKNFLMLTAVGAIAFLYSCSEEDEPTAAAPSISVSAALADGTALADGGNVITGNTITVTVNATTPGGFNVIRATSGGATTEVTRTDLELDAGATSGTALLTVETPDEAVGNTIDWTFTIVDDLNQTGETTFSYTIDAEPSPVAKVQSAVLLFAPTANEDSKTFYSIADNMVYSVNDVEAATTSVSSTIDIGYFYVTEANIASPADYSDAFTGAYDLTDWDRRRSTSMVLTTLTDVTEIRTVADVTNAIGEVNFTSDGATTIEGLSVGDVYAFETEDGVQGLMRVVGIDPGFESDDDIELEFILAIAAEG